MSARDWVTLKLKVAVYIRYIAARPVTFGLYRVQPAEYRPVVSHACTHKQPNSTHSTDHCVFS